MYRGWKRAYLSIFSSAWAKRCLTPVSSPPRSLSPSLSLGLPASVFPRDIPSPHNYLSFRYFELFFVLFFCTLCYTTLWATKKQTNKQTTTTLSPVIFIANAFPPPRGGPFVLWLLVRLYRMLFPLLSTPFLGGPKTVQKNSCVNK